MVFKDYPARKWREEIVWPQIDIDIDINSWETQWETVATSSMIKLIINGWKWLKLVNLIETRQTHYMKLSCLTVHSILSWWYVISFHIPLIDMISFDGDNKKHFKPCIKFWTFSNIINVCYIINVMTNIIILLNPLKHKTSYSIWFYDVLPYKTIENHI